MLDTKTYKWMIPVFAYYLYPFVLNEAVLLSYCIIYGIPFLYIILNYRLLIKFAGKMKKCQFLCLFLVCLLCLASIIYPTIHGTNDLGYIKAITFVFRKLLVYVFLCMVLIKKYKDEARPELFMYYFCIATLLYVVVTLCFIGMPSIKTFWVSRVNSESIIDRFENRYGYVARTGWQGFSGFRNTLRCSLCIIFLLYLFYERRQIKSTVFVTLFAFCFIGNLFYGRSGVAVSFFCIFVAIFLYKIVRPVTLFRWIAAAIILFIVINLLQRINPLLQQWYIWMSQPFINLLRTGSFNNISVDTLLGRMIFLPSTRTLFLGDGRYISDGHYYMQTDSGFMRQILFWGVPCTLLSYYATWLSMKRFSQRKIIILIISAFILFEIKAEVYYEFIPWMLSLSFLENWKERLARPKGNFADE